MAKTLSSPYRYVQTTAPVPLDTPVHFFQPGDQVYLQTRRDKPLKEKWQGLLPIYNTIQQYTIYCIVGNKYHCQSKRNRFLDSLHSSQNSSGREVHFWRDRATETKYLQSLMNFIWNSIKSYSNSKCIQGYLSLFCVSLIALIPLTWYLLKYVSNSKNHPISILYCRLKSSVEPRKPMETESVLCSHTEDSQDSQQIWSLGLYSFPWAWTYRSFVNQNTYSSKCAMAKFVDWY